MGRWFKPAAMITAWIVVFLGLTALYLSHEVRSLMWASDYARCNADMSCMHNLGWSSEWDPANESLNRG